MKNAILCNTLLVSMFISTATFAGGWIICDHITGVHSGSNTIYFKTNVADPLSPCQNKNEWALEKTHAEFETIYKMVLSAQITQSRLWVSGSGVCDSISGKKQKVSSFLLGTW